MKVALVGCGQISERHVSALREIAGLQISAVCDRDRWRAEEIAKRAGGANIYDNLANLLQQEQPDSVHILTPPDSHADLAIMAMEAGCHVLVEKPMATSIEQANRMFAASEKNQVKLSTSHNYLFKPSVARARQLVKTGAIGKVVYVDSFYGLSGDGGSYSGSRGRSHWAWRLRGGVFTNFLPHLVYLQLAFLQQIDSVAGVTFVQPDGPDEPATEMTVLLQGPGASGTMTFSIRAKPYAKFVNIYGTKGMIHADLAREICIVHKDIRLPGSLAKVIYNLEGSLQLVSGTTTNVVKVMLGKMKDMPGLSILIRDFYASIKSGHPAPVTAKDGQRMVEVMEMVWAKAQQKDLIEPAKTLTASPKVPRTAVERLVAEQGMPGKVLVTGATGLLGQHLVAALSRCNVDVLALVRDKSRASAELERQATLMCSDVRDLSSLKSAMQGVAIVYHCAAITSNYALWTTHYDVNIAGTKNVFEAALQAGVQRVVHVSSIIVSGVDQPPGNGAISESTHYAPKPDKWAHYMRSKIEADKLAFTYWRERGLPVTVIRPGILYELGPVKLGAIQPVIGSGSNLVPLTFVNNAVDCLLLAAIRPEAVGQAYNVVDEPQITTRDIFSRIEQATGESIRLVPIPGFLLTGVAGLLEMKNRLTRSEVPPKLSRFAIRSAARNLRYDTSKAKEQLGWQTAITFEECLRGEVISN